MDAVYIELSKGTYDVSRELSESIIVDKDAKGKILGIEILDATKNIEAFDPQKTTFSVQTR